ncbi:hypothetical protein DRO59_00060 [Candidatus Bathyarchaeota archaeon]|nr:MAG: hypothetical protein DRO59_00060 [Candidatus Bathyarchaeota archaeon]
MCSEYGWTPDQVFNLTRATVSALLESAMKRKKEEYKFYASCAGAKLQDEITTSEDLLRQVKQSGIPFEVKK